MSARAFALRRVVMLGGLALALSACGSSSGEAPADPGGGGSDAEAPILDAKLFDCTRAKDPDRVATTPVACGLDPACTTRQVSAHRGAGGQLGKLAPEDTLAAYRAGIALGVDYVETDPRPTKDGVLVNLHDTTVDRTTDGTGEAAAMTLAELQALHVESTFPGDFSCETIPTLEDILKTCRGKAIVLVDANKTDRVDLLVGAIKAADALEWAIFDTSSTDKIDQAIAIEPALRTMIRVASVDDLNAQLDHFAAHPPAIVELESNAPTAATAAAAHARGMRAFSDCFGQDLAADLDGKSSHYADVYALGVDIAQSDRPDLVLEFLGRR